MISHRFTFFLIGAGILVLGAAIVAVKVDNARLRRRVSDTQRQHAEMVRLREENRQSRTLIDRSRQAEDATGSTLRDQLRQLREEIGRREKQAQQIRAGMTQDAAHVAAGLAVNRDLSAGWVRLEHLGEAGNSTPESTLQTLIWAALSGKEAQLRSVIAFSDETRREALALTARLPPDAQAAWTPERLAALYFSGFFNEVSAAKADPVTHTDVNHATMLVHCTDGTRQSQVPLTLTRDGEAWRIQVPEKAIRALEGRMRASLK